LTLPAQRHVVRVATPAGPVWLVALQKDGSDGHMLVMLRSDDEAQSFHFDQTIQDNPNERDTADLVVSGSDVALVYSYE